MANLSDLRDRVRRVLSDMTGGQYTADLLDNGINAAQEAILPWLSKRSLFTCTGDVEGTSSWQMPADLYRIVAVFDQDSGMYIPQNTLSARQSPGADLESNQDWMEFPEGYLSLANSPATDSEIVVHYGAVWEPLVDDDDVIEVPTWIHRALIFYAASYALLEKASSSANIRQWNVQVDSGTPVMNPMRDMSSYYLERFRIEMDRVPAHVRGSYG